jgi:hypothetical protein
VVVPASKINQAPDAEGVTTFVFNTDFEDSFLNQGRLSVTVKGNTCVVNLVPKQTTDVRAVRQYDTYTLQRQP